MAGDWRNEDRWRNQNRDRWPHERGWQRDWDVETNRQYGGGRDRDYPLDSDYANHNSGRYGSGGDRGSDWSSGRGEGPYGSVYGGYGGRDQRDRNENRWRSGNERRNMQSSDYPDYGWASGGYGGGRGYGRDYGDYGRGAHSGVGYGGVYDDQERGFWDRASDEVSSWFGDEQAERRRTMDQQGGHRGRGPKGYTRSDDRIREDVSDALSDDHHVDASEITVAVSGSEVTLTGTVASRQEKRRAEDCADRVSGVKHVQNNLRVKETTPSYSSSGFGSGADATSGTSTTNTTATGANRQKV